MASGFWGALFGSAIGVAAAFVGTKFLPAFAPPEAAAEAPSAPARTIVSCWTRQTRNAGVFACYPMTPPASGEIVAPGFTEIPAGMTLAVTDVIATLEAPAPPEGAHLFVGRMPAAKPKTSLGLERFD
ncbi:MAG: hypothetical protein K2Q06_07865, partial [Parvularculaceae bacterium]|nr:hypothetical protein [Parvularculaceae bacterium]